MKPGLIAFLFLLCCAAKAQRQVISAGMHHLRNGATREWDEFPINAERDRWSITFNAEANARAGSIQLRQYDVKQSWLVILNDHQIGKLTEDEKDLNLYLHVNAGLLRDGLNTLEVRPANKALTETDDIKVGDVSYYPFPAKELLSQCRVSVEIRDKQTKQLLPAKITITDLRGTLQEMHTDSSNVLAVRAGTVYTSTGKAAFNLPPGIYMIYGTRGFEYGVDSTKLTLRKTDHLERTLLIEREVSTEGWVSCDTHIHTLTYSGHGDASIEERAITIAGEGIELPVITEHNKAINIQAVARKLQVDRWFTPVTGNELTTTRGHFNIFPADATAKPPDHHSPDWKRLSEMLAAEKSPVVILNHGEDIHNNFRPFDPSRHIAVAGMMLQDSIFPANAMEVMNSGSQQHDILKLYHDWFGMMNRGYFITPVGSSDSHDVNRFMVGQARTYIKAADTNFSAINIEEATRHFLLGKVMVSFGLLTTMEVNSKYESGDLVPGNEKIIVSIKVLGPKWIDADKVTLFANGKKIREAYIKTKGKQVLKWKGTFTLPSSAHDVYLVAIAEGAGKNLPFWKIAKPYQNTSSAWKPKVIGSTGSIWIDADRDGSRTTAYDYAKSVMTLAGSDIKTMIRKLASYDEAVSIQAAALLWEKGYDMESALIREALVQATTVTKSGFHLFNEARKKAVTRNLPDR
jgi:hypothetical protein